jgi:Na+/H+ antiporter NhaD/arsenite permease-like protein
LECAQGFSILTFAIPGQFDLSVYVSLAFLFGIAAQFRSMDGFSFLRRIISLFERRIGILFTVIAVATIFSPFILNDVVVIILTPAIIRYSKQFRVDIVPLVVAEITFTNIAGSLTPIGNPQNILLWTASKITFHQFVSGTWFELALSGILSALVLLPFRKRFGAPKEYPAPLGSKSPPIYLALVMLIVLTSSILSLPSYLSLGIAFSSGFFFTFRALRSLVKEFDLKSLLILYAFVTTVTVASILLGSVLVPYVAPIGSGTEPYTTVFMGIVSNLISNVPATQLVLATVKIPPFFAPKIAIEAGLAGNIDPIASFANLLALIMVRRAGFSIKRVILLQFLVGIVSFLPAFL